MEQQPQETTTSESDGYDPRDEQQAVGGVDELWLKHPVFDHQDKPVRRFRAVRANFEPMGDGLLRILRVRSIAWMLPGDPVRR